MSVDNTLFSSPYADKLYTITKIVTIYSHGRGACARLAGVRKGAKKEMVGEGGELGEPA